MDKKIFQLVQIVFGLILVVATIRYMVLSVHEFGTWGLVVETGGILLGAAFVRCMTQHYVTAPAT